jgi:hypothetical protein
VPQQFIDMQHSPELRTTVNGMITFLDQSLGNLSAVLKREEMWANTLLVCECAATPRVQRLHTSVAHGHVAGRGREAGGGRCYRGDDVVVPCGQTRLITAGISTTGEMTPHCEVASSPTFRVESRWLPSPVAG